MRLHKRARLAFTHIYCFCDTDCIEQVSRLVTQYGDCAFLLFTTPEVLTSENVARLYGKHNLMVSVLVDSPAFSDCAARLREGKFLFAAHSYYTDSCDALASILEEVILPSHCVFTFFIAGDEAACRRGSRQHHRSAQYGKRSVTDGFDRFTFRFIVYRPNRFRRGVLRRLLRGRERIFVWTKWKLTRNIMYAIAESRIY